MDDLRWILLLVGAVVVVAIYFSSRFECEDWNRERERFRRAKKKVGMKPPKPIVAVHDVRPAAPVAPKVKKEPHMDDVTGLMTEAESGQASKTSMRSEPIVAFDEPNPSTSNPPTSHPSKDSTELEDEVIAAEKVVVEKTVVENVVIEHAVAETRAAEKTVVEKPIIEKPVAEDAIETATVEQETDEQEKTAQHYLVEEDGIEDQITGVEIPADLAVAEAQIQAEQESNDTAPEKSNPERLPLGIEPLVLAVSVMAEDGDNFSGIDVQDALEAEGLFYGDMRIFHYFDAGEDRSDTDEAVFSVANVTEPGFFDLAAMEDLRTPGIMLFCQLPGPKSGDEALAIMLDKGRGLAVRLHGKMCDDRRNVFTSQAKIHYLDRIAEFNRELVLARKKENA